MDVAKRLNAKADQLAPGEVVAVGALCAPTMTRSTATAGVLFGVIGMAVAQASERRKTAARAAEAPIRVSSQFPAGHCYIGLTSIDGRPNRLVIFEHGSVSGKAKDLVGTLSFDQVRSYDAKHRWTKSQIRLTFVDGSSYEFESPKGAKPKLFTDGLDGNVRTVAQLVRG